MTYGTGATGNTNHLWVQTTVGTSTTSIPQLWNGPPGGLVRSGGFLLTDRSPTPNVIDDVERARTKRALEQLAEELAREKVRQEAPPMHWWIPSRDGHVCAVCDFDNIYRGAPNHHMPIIREEPELEDWWRELGAA